MEGIPTERIGRYEITREVGRGTLGVVFKGYDLENHRAVAAKVMSGAIVGDPEVHARFTRQAETMARLCHRNIVSLYELAEHGGLPFIVMEFLAGKDLESFHKDREELSTEKLIDVMAQTAEGLQHVHARDVVHCNIKPAHIRLLDDGTVKIIDFCIAKRASSDMDRRGAAWSLLRPFRMGAARRGRTSQIIGTVNYLSPEQIKGKTIDGRSDLFHLGWMFYEILSHRRLFPGESLTTVLYEVLSQSPPRLRELHGTPFEWLEAVIIKCLEKDPEKRWSSGEQLASVLRGKIG